jgi:arginyl-tRNA synthetase
VQYSCARINSMLRKFGEVPAEVPKTFPLTHDSEWRLVTALADFPKTVTAAVAARAIGPIGQYVLDVARQFTTFYHDCPVLTADSDDLKLARVQLCRATLQTLTNALRILGIEALERM